MHIWSDAPDGHQLPYHVLHQGAAWVYNVGFGFFFWQNWTRRCASATNGHSAHCTRLQPLWWKIPETHVAWCWSLGTKYSALQVCTVTPHYLLILPLFYWDGTYILLMHHRLQASNLEKPWLWRCFPDRVYLYRALDSYTEVLLIVLLTTGTVSSWCPFKRKDRQMLPCQQEPGEGGRLQCSIPC